jgi:hypothetical protein
VKTFRVLTGGDLPRVMIGIQIGSRSVYMRSCHPIKGWGNESLAQVGDTSLVDGSESGTMIRERIVIKR